MGAEDLAGVGVGALKMGGMGVPALPLITGGIELISGLIKQHQANKLKDKLQQPDAHLMQFMDEIDRQRKSFETGSAYASEMRELKNTQSATQAGIVQAAKGQTGSALQAIEQVGLNTGLGYGKIAKEGEQRQDLYTQMYGKMVTDLEGRQHAENMDFYNQKAIDARDAKTKGLQTLLNTAAISGKAPSGGTPKATELMALLQQMMSKSTIGKSTDEGSAFGGEGGRDLGERKDIGKLVYGTPDDGIPQGF